MNNLKTRKIIASILIIISASLIIYGLYFSEGARIKNNLKDFDRVESFSSEEIEQRILDEKFLNKSRSFTIKDKTEFKNLNELGKVNMLDRERKKFSDFLLYESDNKYIVYMRNIYMELE